MTHRSALLPWSQSQSQSQSCQGSTSGDSGVSANTPEDTDTTVPGWGEASAEIWQMLCVQHQQDYGRV